MTFQPAGEFLFLAAKKYNLDKQVAAGIGIERIEAYIEQSYPLLAEHCHVTKIEHGKMTIEVNSSAAKSDLFMRTHEILMGLDTLDLPQKIKDISIVNKA